MAGFPKNAERRRAARRRRRMIMNNDGCDCRSDVVGEVPSAEAFLAKRTTPLAGSHVDAVFYSTGVFNLYSHRSAESELWVDSPHHIAGKQYALWSEPLIREGKDALELMIEFCRRQGMEIFWSMRMNDTHDAAYPGLMCQWKKDHPELLMGRKPDRHALGGGEYPDCLLGDETDAFPHGGGRWSALNYGMDAVRDKALAILGDVAARYDIDGVELDFFRHPVYFKPQLLGEPVTERHCAIMTELVCDVRRLAEDVGGARGRPLLVATRVPDSVGFARAVGLDWPSWAEQGAVDLLVCGGYFQFEPWQSAVAVGKRFDTPVYPCLSGSRLVDPAYPEGESDPQIWRGEALKAWEAGASGVYTFNRFDPSDSIFRELGDPEILASLPRRDEFFPGQHMDRWVKDGSRFVKLS